MMDENKIPGPEDIERVYVPEPKEPGPEDIGRGYPICPIGRFFEDDRYMCDLAKCDWNTEIQQCRGACEIPKTEQFERLRVEYKKAIKERDEAKASIAAKDQAYEMLYSDFDIMTKKRNDFKAKYDNLREQHTKVIKDLNAMKGKLTAMGI